ncbi:MAG: TIGR01777 family protein [Chthoniobacterales bacterium]|nr:TIGR01777 family protein [Chthoniobacterales bacterium]
MRLGITGASGFIGSRAMQLAAARGWDVVPFSRRPRESSARLFVPGRPADVDGLDAVLHLAGEPVFGRWTADKRNRIMASRVLGTRSIAEGFARSKQPPRVLVSGSAVGFYGNTGDHEVTEQSPAGSGFLADVCRAWEGEAEKISRSGARLVLLRTGFVLGRGGAMNIMLPVFRAGLGGRLGSGRQWMSCIHVDDVAGMALWAAENGAVRGPLNAVMPHPLTNAEFTRDLSGAVHRPAIFHAPSFLLRLVLGRMASLLLDSSRVLPGVALAGGYDYVFTDVGAALRDIVD